MSGAWPRDVARVAAFLEEAHAEARLEELSADGATAEEAAEAIGCGLDGIAKSILLLCDDAPVLVVLPGDRRVDTGKAARLAGARRAWIARPDEVVSCTGFVPGAVAPFPLPDVREVIVDRRLLAQPVVWASGGSPRHLIALAPAELVRLARGRIEDIALEQTV